MSKINENFDDIRGQMLSQVGIAYLENLLKILNTPGLKEKISYVLTKNSQNKQ